MHKKNDKTLANENTGEHDYYPPLRVALRLCVGGGNAQAHTAATSRLNDCIHVSKPLTLLTPFF